MIGRVAVSAKIVMSMFAEGLLGLSYIQHDAAFHKLLSVR